MYLADLAQTKSSKSNSVCLFVQSCLGSLRTVILFEFKILRLDLSVPDLRISGLRIKMCLGVYVRSGDATHYPGSGDTPTLRGLAPIINTSHIVLVNRLHLTWNAFLFFTMCSILACLLPANVTIYFSFMSHKLTNFCVSLPPEPFAGFLREFTPTVFLPWRNHWSWKRSG